jgi:quinol monooxygenase YgiN
MKYARNLQFLIQPGKDAEFARLMKTEVLPILKRHKGFQSEVALVNDERAIGISFWDDRASAESYAATGYADVVQKLTPVMNGQPKVESFTIASTTLSHTA